MLLVFPSLFPACVYCLFQPLDYFISHPFPLPLKWEKPVYIVLQCSIGAEFTVLLVRMLHKWVLVRSFGRIDINC